MIFQKKKVIVTHSSHFHPDDVCAVAVLHILLDGKYKIVRSRDPKVIASGDYVVDVGGIHNPALKRFDHHQNGGSGKRENGAPYAAFGLVWKEYGEKICDSKEVAEKIDEKIVQPSDVMDNGIDLVEPKIENVYPYSFSDFLFSWNPFWNEDENLRTKNFKKAVTYAVCMLQREIERKKQSEIGKKLAETDYQNAKDKKIIELSGNYPWTEVFTNHPEPIFVIKKTPEDNTWGVKCVPVDKNSFTLRKQLPEEWAGKSGVELAQITGISDAVFCHNGRFLIIVKSKEGAIALAKKAIER